VDELDVRKKTKNKQIPMKIPTLLAITAMTSFASGATYSINPASTYLRTTDGLSPFILELNSIGISSGDTITIARLGLYSGGTGFADENSLLTGVFSSSSILLPTSELNRIPGAIDAGLDYNSPSLSGGIATNISEDFIIDNEVDTFSAQMIVPTGALYLFIGIPDTINGDNTDPNGDFGVSITAVPEPSIFAFVGFGCLFSWRRSRHRKAN
jgi:hypothetical protein